PDRRPGHDRRGRVRGAAGPDQGADQPWRREDRAARDRRGAAPAPGGGGGGDVRRPPPLVGRGGGGGGRAPRRGREARADGLLPAAPGRLQGASPAALRQRDPAHRDRQGPAPPRRRRVHVVVRFAVLGAGATGGYLGACLATSGQDVTLIA